LTKFSKTLAINQYSETNLMHFLFNLLRINGLYMFRALLAHPQEALNKRHMVYCVRVMSVDCTRIGAPHQIGLTLLLYYDARPTKHSVVIKFVQWFLNCYVLTRKREEALEHIFWNEKTDVWKILDWT
jgi:hypothetical protein